MTGLHHVEVWVSDFASAASEWGWLLDRLGFSLTTSWEQGQSWTADGAYLTLTTSPNTSAMTHERRRPRVNPLAFEGETRADVDSVMAEAPSQGWRTLYDDHCPVYASCSI